MAKHPSVEELSQRIRSLEDELKRSREAEERLRRELGFHRAFVERMPEPVFRVDAAGVFRWMNFMAAGMLGGEPRDFVGKAMRDFFPESVAEDQLAQVREAISSRQPKLIEAVSMLEGKEIWFRTHIQPVEDPETGEVLAQAISHNITDLRTAEALFRSLFISAEVGLYIAQEGRFKVVNPYLCRISGYGEKDLLGIRCLELVVEEDREDTREAVIKMLMGERRSPYEFRVWDKRGHLRWLLETVSPIQYEGQPAVLGNQVDITEKKRGEEEQVRTQKLESIGALADGIAHDFNNLLTVIMGHADLAQDDAEAESDLHWNLDEVRNACLRAKELTDQFRTFSSSGAPCVEVGLLAPLVKSAVSLAMSGSKATCSVEAPDDLWPVRFDEAQIKLAITNLVTNAREAMPEGGRIRVRVENLDVWEGEGGEFPVAPGRYVRIVVRDEGVGISPENLPRVMEPYFSTKTKGVQKGMGLGLATAHSIVRGHGGHLQLESTVGEGTAVSLYFPAAEERHEEPASETRAHKVLLLDDERMVRDVSAEILRRYGYRVVLAEEGSEAVSHYREAMENGEPFDVVILDLTIRGGLGGRETMEQLLKMDPAVNGIVLSGYTDDPVMSRHQEFGFKAALSKPFKAQDLKAVLGSVLPKRCPLQPASSGGLLHGAQR